MNEEIKNIIQATSMGKLEKEAVLNSLLNLHIVSQQRELLAFRKWQKENWKNVYLYSDEFMISEFEKTNCD